MVKFESHLLSTPDVPDQLVGYKVVTGLLCVLVLVVLMVRFGQPSLKAFRKRRESQRPGPVSTKGHRVGLLI